MTCYTFLAIKSPVLTLNLLGFPNTIGIDWHDLTHLPYDHEPHTNIKSTRILKYTAKRSF
ncbi:uncharacterized protein G2W53_040247 [Senna tora]|uniref:Uncharacterized protein n=1 Tax=Senna tora TaxID=362788 RepID=A0A834W6X1_9FABA|nr:uncharacterized protein G2W53_040247 [Senna tora]